MVAKMLGSDVAERAQEESRQVLTFLLNGQDYGLELIKVQEIRGFTQITPIPNMPAHIKGVMNLRGAVLPVVDMRTKFGMPQAAYTKFTVIIIAHSAGKSVGLIVDSVSDVLSTSDASMQSPPDFGETTDARFVQALIKSGDHLVVLLDLERLLTESEITKATVSEAA